MLRLTTRVESYIMQHMIYLEFWSILCEKYAYLCNRQSRGYLLGIYIWDGLVNNCTKSQNFRTLKGAMMVFY